MEEFARKTKLKFRISLGMLVFGIILLIFNITTTFEESQLTAFYKFKMGVLSLAVPIILMSVSFSSGYYKILKSDFTMKEHYLKYKKDADERTIMISEKVNSMSFYILFYTILIVGSVSFRFYREVGIICFALVFLALILRAGLSRYYDRKY